MIDINDVWKEGMMVLLKGYRGFHPHKDGSVYFARKSVRNKFVEQVDNRPFITVVYSIKGTGGKALSEKISGFYLTTCEKGERPDFSDGSMLDKDPEKYRFLLRVDRAFKFKEEEMIRLDELDRSGKLEAGSWERKFITDEEQIARLRNLRFEEVSVYPNTLKNISEVDVDINSFWTEDMDVLLKGHDRFAPDKFGGLHFTVKGRRDKLIEQLSDPFIALVYCTDSTSEEALKGKIAGFYLTTHEPGHRNEFSHPSTYDDNPKKWQYGLRIDRAFKYLPEEMIGFDDLGLPGSSKKMIQPITGGGKILTDKELIARLKNLRFKEFPVYNSSTPREDTETEERDEPQTQGSVRGGPSARAPYTVTPQEELPYQLYVFHLKGETQSYLGDTAEANGRNIYKIGLSNNPKGRIKDFQNALPRGAFQWKELCKTEDSEYSEHFPFSDSSHDAVKKGEDEMKKYLSNNAHWLDGEFYLATDKAIKEAWDLGHKILLQN